MQKSSNKRHKDYSVHQSKKKRKFNPFILPEDEKQEIIEEKFVWKKNSRKLDENSKRELHEDLLKIQKIKHQTEWEKRVSVENRLKLERERKKVQLENGEEFEEEEHFNLRQLKLKSSLRIERGRAKPIDVFSQRLQGGLKIHFEPYKIIDKLVGKDLDDFCGDVEVNLKLDHSNHSFWVAFSFLCKKRKEEIEKEKEKEKENFVRSDEGIHSSLKSDIESILKGKNHSELIELENEVNATLKNNVDIDVEYWEALRKEIQVWKARRKIFEINESLEHDDSLKSEDELLLKMYDNPQKDEDSSIKEVEGGNFSIRSYEEFQKITHHMEEENEENSIEVVPPGDFNKLNKEFEKPKFVAKTYFGYDWTKYNRAHYDEENPPPKRPKKYKIFVYYPLAKKTPQYYFEELDEKEKILVLNAGKPYKEIAFRVVNQEWEKSERRGYRCVFERGTFVLSFSMKRHRYRR